ncbi:hypothetical protein QLH64_03490 [Pseudomonas brassicacearum]|nr:hypothetical protein [Pseudomonas brassicacearum]WHS55049.1 hypothetical protein QLH64_03490 [Pseudomonas brassicacearum]
MHLIDSYLPTYQFSELHTVDIPVDPSHAMAAILAHRPEDDRFFGMQSSFANSPCACWVDLRIQALINALHLAWIISRCFSATAT